MDAHKAIITNIFNNSTLIEVPFFQRAYVWKEDLWARMIEDMEFMVKTNKPHFFGSIILKEGRRPNPDDNFTDCRTIVDGQQRLTTFLLFMKVLCLKLGQPTTFDCQFRIMGQSIALRHGRNDVEAFELVTSSTSAAKIDNSETQSRIIEAYNYFVDHIDENKLNIMSVMMNAQFVRIDLNADEDEQQIFDTINSLGVNLTTSELLKNYFFSRDTITAMVIMVLGFAIFQLFPSTLLGLFDASETMLAIGVPALRIISVSFLLAGFCIIAGSVFQAIGNPVYSLIVSVCRQMVVLLPVAWLLSRTGRLELVWWSFPIAEVMSFTLSTIFLRRTVKSANEVMNSSAD